MAEPSPTSSRAPFPRRLQLQGVALFLFIPLVLVLFVRHPEPIAASLGLGLALMIGHRRLARPYLERVREVLCLWCHRPLGNASEPVTVGPSATRLELRACPGHGVASRRFLAHLGRHRLAFRLAIGLPLLALLVALATAAATASGPWLLTATRGFQLAIGIAVNVAALPLLWPTDPGDEPAPAAFPVHNLHLLGVRLLLWVLRLVGLAWIGFGLVHFLAR